MTSTCWPRARSVEQAEALLEALNGPRNDGAAGAGYAHGARGSDRAFEETAAAGRGHMHGSEGRRGGRAFDQRLIADRIAKVAAEMGEAGQELPMRLSNLLDSLVNLASRFKSRRGHLKGLVEQDRSPKSTFPHERQHRLRGATSKQSQTKRR